jgi:plastocyanin
MGVRWGEGNCSVLIANDKLGLFRATLFAFSIVLLGACAGSDGDISLVADATPADSEDKLGYAFAGDEVMGRGPTLTVTAGEEVTLNLENHDTLESHNFAVVPQLDDIPTLVALGLLDEEILWEASIDDLSEGESGSVTFTPDTPGSYYYICTLPGHANAGMMGELIVVDEG